MSEEEENAIKNLSDFAYVDGWLKVKDAKTILNYIDRLEKENNRLKDKLGYTRKLV